MYYGRYEHEENRGEKHISHGSYNILFFSVYLKVKTFLKIFYREDCVNIWLL
jgi:hypothetical protein